MPQFFLNKRLIVLLVSIILLVALIGISLKERKSLTWPEQFVKDTVGVVERVFQKPASYVAGFFENVEDIKRTYEENKQLKEKLDKYATLSTDLKRIEEENKELREVIGAKDSLRDYKPTHATVISRNPDKWYDLIGIDKGAQQGIKKRYGSYNCQRLSRACEERVSIYVNSRIAKFYEPYQSCLSCCSRTKREHLWVN